MLVISWLGVGNEIDWEGTEGPFWGAGKVLYLDWMYFFSF